jgi:nucleotide-binding universal stress UspA family protein
MEVFNWQRILVPTDLSPFADKAVRHAHLLAEGIGAELHVLHVAQDVAELIARLPVTGVIEPADPKAPDDYQQWLAALLGESGRIRRVEAVRVATDVAAAINQYAEENDIGLIVLATHGQTGLLPRLMGGVAEKLVRTARCPVLVIRP